MANKFRGETEIEIGGVKYLLRPTFEGLLEMEDKAGCGLMDLVNSVSKSKISTRHAIAILFGGVLGGGLKIQYQEFGEKCVEHGMLDVAMKAASFLGEVMKTRQKKTDQ